MAEFEISPERQRELRETVGRLLFQGVQKDVESLLVEVSGKAEELGEAEVAECEFMVGEFRMALERALTEPSGALRRGTGYVEESSRPVATHLAPPR